MSTFFQYAPYHYSTSSAIVAGLPRHVTARQVGHINQLLCYHLPVLLAMFVAHENKHAGIVLSDSFNALPDTYRERTPLRDAFGLSPHMSDAAVERYPAHLVERFGEHRLFAYLKSRYPASESDFKDHWTFYRSRTPYLDDVLRYYARALHQEYQEQHGIDIRSALDLAHDIRVYLLQPFYLYFSDYHHRRPGRLTVAQWEEICRQFDSGLLHSLAQLHRAWFDHFPLLHDPLSHDAAKRAIRSAVVNFLTKVSYVPLLVEETLIALGEPSAARLDDNLGTMEDRLARMQQARRERPPLVIPPGVPHAAAVVGV
jgi:hypothetical protein